MKTIKHKLISAAAFIAVGVTLTGATPRVHAAPVTPSPAGSLDVQGMTPYTFVNSATSESKNDAGQWWPSVGGDHYLCAPPRAEHNGNLVWVSSGSNTVGGLGAPALFTRMLD